MQYSPKLKKAMEQIKTICKEADIAAFVILHENGFSEFSNIIQPSWSCAKIVDNGINFKIKQDEIGIEKAQELAQCTYNMVRHFSEVIGSHAITYIDAYEILKKHFDGRDAPGGGLSDHITQNN